MFSPPPPPFLELWKQAQRGGQPREREWTQDRDPGTLLTAAYTHGLRGAAVSQAP